MGKIILIGCGKAKRNERCRASDLYCGPFFRQRLAYAKRQVADSHDCEYAILSARFGLVKPDTELEPYDHTMAMWSCLDRIAWVAGVVVQLCEYVDNDLLDWADIRSIHIELHAGADYAEPLVDVLRNVGFSASWPVKGMAQGQQMRWYSQHLQGGFAAAR